jgi:hypothetical protein
VPTHIQITLFCPGALAGPFDQAMSLLGPSERAWVSRLLKRSTPRVSSPLSISTGRRSEPAPIALESPDELWLRQAFGLAPEASVGAYEAFSGATGPERWIARLVNFHVGLDHLVLQPPEQLNLDPEDAATLLAASQHWLSSEPVRIDAIDPALWQLTELEPEKTRFTDMQGASSRRASGRNIDAWLPRGPASRGWRRLANELQMMWHSHPVNARRIERGLPAINGLWFEGRATPLHHRAFDTIVSNDPALKGLARACGATLIDERNPARIADSIRRAEEAASDPATWLIDPGFGRWTHDRDGQPVDSDWARHWADLTGWLIELDSHLRVGRGRALRWVLAGDHSALTLDIGARDLLRFWRNRTPGALFEHRANE